MTTPDLFDYAPPLPSAPFQRHSETSREAAKRINPCRSDLHRKILEYLRAHSEGATDEQLIDGLGIQASTLRPRRIELVALGLVLDSRTTRLTHSRRSATVWVLNLVHQSITETLP